MTFALDPKVVYRELRDPPLPAALRAAAEACFAAQRRAARRQGREPASPADRGEERERALQAARRPERERARRSARHPERDDARRMADAAELARLLAGGEIIGGVVRQREIATAVPFNARQTRDAVRSAEVERCRARVDVALGNWLDVLFAGTAPPVLSPAGHWWYPPGTCFGWHTNRDYPGWRLYLTHAEEPGRSFFRYRHPESGAVVTSPDATWHLRLFEVSSTRPFWHAIYSDTHRFSIGWQVRPRSATALLRAALERLRRAAGTRLTRD